MAARRKPADGVDLDAVAAEQIDALIDGADVNPAKRDLALARHAGQVRAAGEAVEPDFYTRQFVHPARVR